MLRKIGIALLLAVSVAAIAAPPKHTPVKHRVIKHKVVTKHVKHGRNYFNKRHLHLQHKIKTPAALKLPTHHKTSAHHGK